MLTKHLTAVLLLTSLPSMVAAQDAETVIGNAAKVIGADSLKSVRYSGSGSEFSFGQAVNPTQPWPAFVDTAYTRTINFETPAFRLDRVLAPVPPMRRGGGLPPGPTQTVIVNASTPWQQQLDIWMTPHGFLKAAAARRATVRSQTTGGQKYTVVTFVGQNKANVNGYIGEHGTLDRVETWIDSAVLGDTLFEAIYTDYKDVGGGVKFPGRILLKQGGWPTLDLAVTTVTPNIPVDIQPPARPGGAPGASGGSPAPTVPTVKLADDVYVILGGYATLAVNFKDYVVAIEGPQSETRATAIIAGIHETFPNKPIKYVVNTHSHFDHSNGLRPFVADGATIITHQSNKGYFEKVFSNPHTIAPDRLAETKKKVNVETFADKRVLSDGSHIVELYHLRESPHSDGLIVAYLPKEKILVEADAFNPPAQSNASPPSGPVEQITANLLENLARLKLDVEIIVPVHYPPDNRIVKKAELMKWAGRPD